MKTFLFLLILLTVQSSLAEIGINPTAKTFAKEGGGGAIFVSGTGSWEASSASPWITVFTPVGNGQGTVAYLVSLNNSADTRQGTILVSDKVYTITQNGYDSSISPTSTSVAEGGGSGVVSVTVGPGISWTAISDVDWIQVDSAGGLSSGQVNYTVEVYEGVQPRFGSITIAGNTFDVTQTGGDLALSPSSASLSYGATAIPNIGVEALTSTTWSVVSNATWISVVDAGRGFGDSAITLGVGENPSYLERVGTVSVGSKTFTVTQEGTPNLRLEITPTEATADASGAIGNVAVLATPDAPWTSETLAPWITVSGGSTGAGNGNISYVVSPNTNLEERIGQIRVNPPVPQPKPDLDKGLLLSIRSSFSIIEGNFTWQEAKADAEAKGGRLAVLDTQVKIDSANTYLEGLGVDWPNLWIGLSDEDVEGQWKWINDNLLSANNWGGDEPNGGTSENHAILGGKVGTPKGWLDIRGTLPEAYLLEAQSGISISIDESLSTETMDESGWARSLGADNHLEGPSLQRQTDAFSMVVDFNVEALDSIKRLSEVTRPDGSYSTIWVNSSNEVVFRSGSEELKSIPLPATGNYRAYVTASESNDVNLVILSAPTGAADPVIISSGSEQFSQPPFPVDIELGDIRLKESNVPSVGQLREAFISGYKLYERALTQKEIEKYDTNDEAYVPDEPVPTQHFNLDGGLKSSLGSIGLSMVDEGLVLERGYKVDGFSENILRGTYDIPSGESLQVEFDYYLQKDSSYGAIVGFGNPGGYPSFQLTTKNAANSIHPHGSVNFPGQFSQNHVESIKYGKTNLKLNHDGRYVSYAINGQEYGGVGAGSGNKSSLSSSGTFQVGKGLQSWIANEAKSTEGIVTNLVVDGGLTIAGIDLNDPPVVKISTAKNNLSGASKKDRSQTEGGALRISSSSKIYAIDDAFKTFASWIKFDSSADDQDVINSGLVFDISNGDLFVNSIKLRPVEKGKWAHLSYSISEDGFYRVYYNGEETGSGEFSRNNFRYFTMSFDGAVDMVSTYADALTSAQIRSIYESQKPQTYFHTITQGAFQPSVEPSQATVSSSGGSASTNLILSGNVQWTATTTTPWLNITSSTTGAGSAEIRVVASRNPTVYERTGTVLVAGQTFSVIQPGLNVDLEYEQPIFRAAGGDLTIDVATEAGASWEVSTDVDWIIPVLPTGGSAFGSGSAFIIVAGYSDTTSSRSGILNIAGKEVVISQRGYDLSVSPQVAEVGSNAGAGEFGVTAPLTAVWEAIVTEPWITLIGGQDGRGNGTVRYSLGSNTTGAPRTGKVIVSGEEYLITQYAGIQVTVNAASDGTASGSGSYDTNEVAILTAEADPGYVFSHWTGDGVGSDNPLELIVDSVKSVTANFIPESAVTQFQQPIIAELAAKDQIIAQKDNQIQTRTITIADLQSGIDALALANVELQQSYDAAVASSRQAGRDEVILNPANYGLTTREAYSVPGLFSPLLAMRPSRYWITMYVTIGRRYQLETSMDMTTWEALGEPFTAVSKIAEIEEKMESARKFYRLIELP